MILFDRKRIPLILLFVAGAWCSKAQQTDESFLLETKYLLYLPEGYATDTTTRWPLLIFLHGSGESGDDLKKVKVHGPPKLIEQARKFPFIVVSPQAPPQTGWRTEVLKAMLDDLRKKYRVDNAKLYMTGLSMGGYGTWNFATKYPDELAAIAPVCGGGDPGEAWKMRRIPVWCFHGAKDNVVPPAQSQRMVDALKEYKADVRFTLYPDADHNSWDATYSNDSLYTWLLSHSKFKHKPVNVSLNELKQFEGTYVQDQKKDTLRFVIENERLTAKFGRESIPLGASANDSFYWDENSSGELIFQRDSRKAVIGLLLMSGERDRFRKLPGAGMRKK
jgi:dienelactone hydrolase